MNRLSLILLFLCCGVAYASDPPLTITKNGYFLTEVDESGNPTYVKIKNVIDLTNGDIPKDDPDEPKIDEKLAQDVQKWSEEVNDSVGATAISAVYSKTRNALLSGELNTSNVFPSLKESTDEVLKSVNSVEKWVPFRDKLTAVFTERMQRGELESVQQIENLLVSVQKGLELSAHQKVGLTTDQRTIIDDKVREIINAK